MYYYHTSLTIAKESPAIVVMANLKTDYEGVINMIPTSSYCNQWGAVQTICEIGDDLRPLPNGFIVEWISVIEKKFYTIERIINLELLEQFWHSNKTDDKIFIGLSVGIAPYGGVVIWLYGYYKQILFAWYKAKESVLSQDIIDEEFDSFTINDICEEFLWDEVNDVDEINDLPDPHLFDHMMQQFYYRFQPVLKKWDEDNVTWVDYDEDETQPELDFVEVKCHDGTFDRLRDGSLLNYHEAGKPSRVCVGWHVGKREYSAYFFFSHDELVPIFRSCYGAHPETKVDFLLQIDPESDKYEPALFRFGMKEPMRVGPEACQVLVFRNKFECYRSSNYTQPRGAWR